MNSTLKYGLPVGLAVVAVFVLTLISQNVAVESDANGDSPDAPAGPPLLFTYDTVAYDPAAPELMGRAFHGFYEMSPNEVPIPFWFKNEHKVTVRMAILGRSCTSCSSAQLGVISPEAFRQFGAESALGALTAGGPLAPPSLLAGLSAVAMVKTAPRQAFDMERPEHILEIPAAPASDAVTWGFLELGVKVTGVGPKSLTAQVGMAAGKAPGVAKPFTVEMNGANPFDVHTRVVQFDELPPGSAPQTKQLLCWSSTRVMPGPGREGMLTIPPPTVSVAGDAFLTVGAAVPVPESDFAYLDLKTQGNKPVRVTAAYRIPVTLARKVATATPPEPDIGPYERQMGVTAAGTVTTHAVSVKATITGLVALTKGQSLIDLESFRGSAGKTTKPFDLVSDDPSLQLEPLPGECRPTFLVPTLTGPRTESGRRFWSLVVKVKPGECSGELPADSVIVFKARTAAGEQKVRIPVKGRGTSQ